MKILVTGVTGLLGEEVVSQLSNQFKIIGIGRNVQKGEILAQKYGFDFIQQDLSKLNDSQIKQFADLNIDMVVNIAARSEYWGSYTEFYAANVKVTQNVLKIAKSCKAKRFIQISSPSIYFRFENAENATENYPLPTKFANDYAATKHLADLAVIKSEIPYIILRPRAIFSNHDTKILQPLLEKNEGMGIPLPYRGKKQMVDVTNIENVVEAIRLSLLVKNPQALNQAYNITNGDPRTTYSLLKELTDELKIKLKIKQVPYSLLFAVGYLDEKLHNYFFKNRQPVITRYVASVLGRTQTLSIEKANRLLGYQPIKSIDKGIKDFANENKGKFRSNH